MHAIIGLGNPGSEYHGTRHNVGFAVVDALAGVLKMSIRPGNGDYLIASDENNVLLVKPLTYMNNSGIVVKEIVEKYSINIRRVIVVVDDFHIPLGALRLRTRGSSGGHNGLSSIIWHLNSDEFPRLRCGIGSAHKSEDKHATADFVLSTFESNEIGTVKKMISDACHVLGIAGEQGISAAVRRLSAITF